MLRCLLALCLAVGPLALPAARAQNAADTSYVHKLLHRLRDSSEAVRDSAGRELQSRGVTIVPMLEAELKAPDMRLVRPAAAALVQLGPPALPAIRRALDDTSTVFLMGEALSWGPATDSEAAALIEPLLRDASASVRAAATTAINNYRDGGSTLEGRLVDLLHDGDPDVRSAAAYQIISARDSSTRAAGALALTQLLDDTSRGVRREAVYSLGNMGDVAAPGIPGLVDRMRFDPDTEVRWLAARVLGWLGPQASAAVPALLVHLEDTLPQVRLEALGSLGGIGISRIPVARGDSVIAALRARLVSDDSLTRETAVQALGAIGPRAIPALGGALRSSDSTVATTAAVALGYMPDEASIIAPLDSSLGDPRSSVRDAAADALGGVGEPALRLLRSRASSSDSTVRDAARRALSVYRAATSLPILRECYEAVYGPWIQPLGSQTIEGVVPPEAMRFSSVRAPFPRAPDAYAFVLERRYRGDWYPAGYWIPDSAAHEVKLDPSPNLSGVQMTLTVTSADDVRGTMNTYWDFPAKTQSASVVLTKVACSASDQQR